MFELNRQLDSQLESTRFFFDKADAEMALHEAQNSDDYDEPQLREITIEQFVAEARKEGCDDFAIAERLINESDVFGDAFEKAALYDSMIADRRKGADATNAISPEARKERAKKAAAARWHK